jgi:hypothetical protein
VFGEVEDDRIAAHQQPVQRGLQHGGLADARPADQQQVAALADLLRRTKTS